MDKELVELFLEIITKLRFLIICVFFMGVINFLFSFYLFVRKQDKSGK